jgi:exosome complex RNA-binding protein Csl4
MADENDLAGALKTITKTSDEVYAKVCEVLEIDQDEKTVNVKPVDDTAEIYNVRLQAESETGGLVLFPKVGSMVLVVFINKSSAAVVNTSEIENFSLVISPCKFEVDSMGFLLQKQNETLKKLMSDLIGEIKLMSFTLTTPDTINGTTTVMVNLAEFTAIETRFNQFLK